jgi:hypothetical protein
MIIGPILVLSIALSSCSTSKKGAIDCPPNSLKNSSKISSNHWKAKNNYFFTSNRTKPVKHSNNSTRRNQSKILVNNSLTNTANNGKVSEIESREYLNKAEFSKGLIASIDNKLVPLGVPNTVNPSETIVWLYQQDRCDTIVLKYGISIIGKVEEIGQTEIKYKKCNNLSGPIIAISKSDVSAILYSNGSHDIFTSQNPVQPINSTSPDNGGVKQTEGFAIGGFVSGLAGLFVLPLLFGTVAIVFGAISLSRIKKNPSKYKGKGLAIASIIVGIVGIVAALIITAAAV